jgi:hypothetical protein
MTTAFLHTHPLWTLVLECPSDQSLNECLCREQTADVQVAITMSLTAVKHLELVACLLRCEHTLYERADARVILAPEVICKGCDYWAFSS